MNEANAPTIDLRNCKEVQEYDDIRDMWKWDGNLSRCRSCAEPICWIKTPRGKNMPVSVKTSVKFRGSYYAVSHFSDCPQAEEHRKSRGAGIAQRVEEVFAPKIGAEAEVARLMGWLKWRGAWTGAPAPKTKEGVLWYLCALRGDKPPSGFEAKLPPGAEESLAPF